MLSLCAAWCVTRRKLQTPGPAEEYKRQETPTIDPNDRQPVTVNGLVCGGLQAGHRGGGQRLGLGRCKL